MSDKPDMVNHPPHYADRGYGFECIELTQAMPFCSGNCVKYVFRLGAKGDIVEDLRKSIWYANRAYSLCESGVKVDYWHLLQRWADKCGDNIIREAILRMQHWVPWGDVARYLGLKLEEVTR